MCVVSVAIHITAYTLIDTYVSDFEGEKRVNSRSKHMTGCICMHTCG